MRAPMGLLLAASGCLGACRSSQPAQRPPPPVETPAPGVATVQLPLPPARTPQEVALEVRAAAGSEDTRWAAAVAQVHLHNRPDLALEQAQAAVAAGGGTRWLMLRCALLAQDRRYEPFLDACAEVLTRAPASEEALAALALMDQARGQHAQYGPRLSTAVMQALDGCAVARGSQCAELALLALPKVMAEAGRAGEPKLYSAAASRSGLVTQWTVAGPLASDNVDAFRAWQDVARVSLPGKPVAAWPVPPFATVFRKVPDGALMPARYGPAGLYVAQSAVHILRPTVVTVDLRTSGSARVFISGQPAIVLDRWAQRTGPRVTAHVPLPPGWHRVVVEAAVDATDVVELRLMGPQGSSPIHRVAAALPAGATWSPGAAASHASNAGELEAAIQKAPYDAETALWAALLHTQAGHHPQARALAALVAERFPRSARAHEMAGTTVEDDTGLPDSTRHALAQTHFSRAAQMRADVLVPRYRLAVLAMEQRPDEALRTLTELAQQRPDYPHVWRSLFEIYRRHDWYAEADQALSAALETGATDGVLQPGAAWLRGQGQLTRAALLDDRAQARQDSPYSDARAELLEQRMDWPGAIREWKRLLKAYPAHPAGFQYVTLLRKTGNLSAWKAALDAHLAAFPLDQSALLERCTAVGALQNVKAAGACLADLLERFPSDAAALRLQAELAGTVLGRDGRVPEEMQAPPIIAALEQELAALPAWVGTHGTVVAFDEARREFRKDGSSMLVSHRIIRVGTRQSADDLGEITLGNNDERRILRVLRADGTVVEPELGQGKDAISLSGLSPGDYLEILTVDPGDGSPTAGVAFEAFFFDSSYPVFRSAYEVVYPAELKQRIQLKVSAEVPAPTVMVDDGQVRHSWAMERVAARTPEPFSSPGVEWRTGVLVVVGMDDTADARATCRQTAPTARPSPELQRWVAQLTTDDPAPSVLLDRVVTQVRKRVLPLGSPIEAADVLQEGRGSHFLLVRALLRLAGVPARVVAARTRLAADAGLTLPRSRDLLVLVVPTEHGNRHLASVGSVLLPEPWPPLMVDAVEADCDEMDKLGASYTLPAPVERAWEHTVDMQLEMDNAGNAQGTVSIRLSEPAANASRQQMGRATPQQVEQFMASVLGQHIPGVTLGQVTTSDTAARGGPFTVTALFEARGLARPASGGLAWEGFLERPVSRAMVGALAADEYIRVAERQSPLLLARPLRELARLRIRLPAGASAALLPRPFDVHGAGFDVRQTVTVKGQDVVVERMHQVEITRIQPDAYHGWRQSVERAMAQGRNRLVFRPQVSGKAVGAHAR